MVAEFVDNRRAARIRTPRSILAPLAFARATFYRAAGLLSLVAGKLEVGVGADRVFFCLHRDFDAAGGEEQVNTAVYPTIGQTASRRAGIVGTRQ